MVLAISSFFKFSDSTPAPQRQRPTGRSRSPDAHGKMNIRGTLERLEQRKGDGFLVAIADRIGDDGELITDRKDLEGRKVVLLEPDVARL